MEALLELLLQFCWELFVQLVGEWLVELGLRAVSEPFSAKPRPVLAAIGHGLLGAICGGLSLLLVPHAFIAEPVLRQVNVVLTPLAAGGAMTLLGRYRESRGQRRVSIDRFGPAFLFALAMAVVRYAGAS